MSLKSLITAVILVSLSVKLLALSSHEDTRYLLLQRRKISSGAALIENKAVIGRLSCAAQCNINKECSHFTIDTADATVCELYRTVETSSNVEDAGFDSYFRLNPYGTVARDYLLHLEPLVPYSTDEVLWKEATDDGDHNLILPDVRNLQMCYEICLAFTANHCWVFSYVDKEERCVVPNLYGQMLSHGVREGFDVETVPGAEVYMHNRVLVDNSYGNMLADASFFFVNDSHLHKGDDFADRHSNLRMPGIDNEQYCYRICLITNNATCTMFSYSRELQMCVIPHGDGHTLMQSLYLTKDEQYATFMFDEEYPQELSAQTSITFVDSVFHIGDGSFDLANNRNFSLVSNAQDCFTMCLMTNNGSCLSFSYSETELNCIVPHTLIMEDLGQELTDGYLTTTFVAGYTTTLGTHRYITIPEFISYQGNGSDDASENRKFEKVASTQDCYTLCLKTNENYCLEYSYSTSTLTCVVPHDTGSLNIDSFGQEKDSDYVTNIFTVHTDATLPLHIILTNVIYHKGNTDDSLRNFLVYGVTSNQNCYVMCLERNDNRCFAYSYSSAELVCVVLQEDGTTHLDDTYHDVTSGYLTYRFNDYTERSLPAHLTLSNIIYRKGDGPYDVNANFWTPGVGSVEDCYTLCLDRNGDKCFGFSYHSTEKVCIVLHDDGTTHLDDITSDVSTGYNTYRFNDYTAAAMPLYISLSDVIYHKGSSASDNSSNFVTSGVASKEDCYRLTLDRNDNHNFAFSYSSAEKICVVLHDDGSTHLDDIITYQSTGYITYRFNSYTQETLPAHIILSNVIYRRGINADDTAGNFKTHGVASYEDCYRLCLDRNDNTCFGFSFSPAENVCVVPHDAGAHLDDLSKDVTDGYFTYLFNDYTDAAVPAYLTLTGVIYHKGSSSGDNSSNFVTPGVESIEDCYTLCLDRNEDHCFAMSYSSADKICVVLHDDGSTHLDDITTFVSSGYNTYRFNSYTQTSLTAHIVLSNVLYHKATGSDGAVTNFVTRGVGSYDDCYRLCLDRNDNKCFFFSYSSSENKCAVLHDDGSTHLDDVTIDDASGFNSYLFNDFTSHTLPLYITLSDVIYHKGNAYDDAASNFVTPGVETIEDCYTLCLDRNGDHCFGFSYSPADDKTCVVLHDDGGSTTLDDITADISSGYTTYLFNAYTTRALPLYITLSDVIYHKGNAYDDAASNFVTPGVESIEDCYTLCLDRNGDHCFGFSYSPVDDKTCVVLHDDGGSTTLDDITTDISSDYTTYLFNAYTTRALPLYITLSGVIYHKGNAYDDAASNFVTPGVESIEDCYTLCLDRNGDHCFGFSYSLVDDKTCVVLHDDGGSTTLDDITTDISSDYTTYLFNDYTETGLAANIVLTNIVYRKGTGADDSTANFKTSGVGSHEDCYTLCLDRNDNKCFGFSYSSDAQICVVPHDETGLTTLDDISSDGITGYSTYLFNDFTTRHIPEHVTLTNIIYHKGGSSNDNSSNFISPGVESYDDCYTLCLDRNSDRCFAFSYSITEKICIVLHDDGNTNLDLIDYEVTSGYETYRFNSYTQTSFQPYITISTMIYHKGSGANDAAHNFETEGVESDIDCYRLCLDRNNNYCFGFSYSSTDKTCVVPHDGGGTTTLDDIIRDITSGYTTYLFNDYTTTGLSAHITLSGITYYKGTGADDSDFNFKSEGVGSYEDCYTLCLDRNGNKCFSFSYSLDDTTCVVPHDDGGSTTLDDITTDLTPKYTTYIFNDYTSMGLTPHVTLSEVIYHRGDSPDDDEANFKTQGVGSYENCYTLCMDRNGGTCFAFSYSWSDTTCYALHSTASTHLDDITNQTSSAYTTYLFIDYTTSSLTSQNRLSLDEVIYYKGSGVADSDNNFITIGVGSEQDCYSICLDRNENHCFSFSYSSNEEICRVPHDAGSTLITDITDKVATGYVTTLLTLYAASALSSRSYVTLNDVIYEKGVNFEIAGCTTLQHCYSICLLRNDGDCFSFSFSLADKTCSLPLDSGSTDLDDITNTTADGYQTVNFNTHTSSALTSRNRVTLSAVIYYGGVNLHDTSSNFISDGVGDEQTCYLLCMERNGGNCFSLSYSSTSDRCRFPHSSSSTVITDTPDISVSEYTTYLLTDHSTTSMSSSTYVTITTVKYNVGTNFETFGVGSTQDCFVICRVRNAGQCFSFSYNSKLSLCSVPVVTANIDLDDVTDVTNEDFNTYYYTGYTANTLTSVHRFTLSSIGLHKGTDIADDSANFISRGVTSAQDCYTMCLARNGGHCLAFAYKSSADLCVAAYDDGSSKIQQLTQYSNADYYSVVTAAAYSSSLSARSHITLVDYIYYLGSEPTDSSNNFVLNEVASSENCHTACLLYNQGSCNAYSYGEQTCNIPNANADLVPSDFDRQSNAAYDTVYFTGSYHASHPGSYVVTSDSKWTRSSSQNFELVGVASTTDCYIGCYTENKGYCYIYSYHSTSKICHFPSDSGASYIDSMTQTTVSGYSSYYFVRNEYNLALSSTKYFTLSNRLLHYGSDYDSASNNYAITGVGSLENCYVFALMENSGHKISFSYSSSTKKCYVPVYQDGDYGIASLEQTSLSGYNSVIFESSYTASLPSHITTTNKIIYKGTSYTQSASNFILYGVTSSQDCYTACLIRNQGRCIAFTYKSDMCIVPLDSGTMNVDDLSYTSSSGHTAYIISNGYGMISNHATISNYFYSNGPGTESFHDADSYTDCAILCQLVNSGRCIAFAYNGATCRIPYDTGNLHAQDLTGSYLSGYTTYLVVRDSSDKDISFSSYSSMPSQYMYLGSGYGDSSNNEQWTHVVSSAADCYRLCYLRNGLSCKVFSYATNHCIYPTQSAISRVSDAKVEQHGSWTTYFMFSTTSRSETFPSGSYSYLSNLKIRDGRQGSIYEISFSGVSDVHRCYRLCLQSFSSCQTFSYDTGTDYCYLTSVNFHNEWTYVESDTSCTGYFLKNSDAWKLITKHRQYQNVVPDDAFQHTGSYHTIVPSGDLSPSSSFTTNGNLKNNMIDHWSSLSSRYRVRMVLRNGAGSELRYLQFNAGSTTKTNWFSSTYFSASSWSDLTSSVTHNHWSMQDTYRVFYISRHHNGCQGDNGWIVISASTNTGCSEFDRTSTIPKFVYSPSSTSVNWYNNNYATADVLTIYMSFN